MPITHSDLSQKNQRIAHINSKLAHFLLVFTVLCGLLSFVLCLAAEAARSEVSWMMIDRASGMNTCTYSASGRTALVCAVLAFLLLAVAMFTEHACMLVAVTSPKPPPLVIWTAPEDPRPSRSSRALTMQACALIIATWICFAIAEVLLLIGIGIESGHLSNWGRPRPICPAVRPGVYAAAGVFGLLTVFLGVGLFLTALMAQKLQQEEGSLPQSFHPPNPHHVTPSAPRVP